MSPEQLNTLRTELHTDPNGIGYAQWLPASPGTVADLLNAQTQSMVKALRTTTAKAWAATGPYAAIVDASNSPNHPCRASCLVIRDAFMAGDMIHVELPEMQEMFAGWVTASLITPAQHDDLMARATQAASRAEMLGLPFVTIPDVQEGQ
ncbi:hypothetical protein AB4Z19_15565 [Pseudoduganella sp. RAF19]|uniref:hypothetical protein n=1 Tax=Bacteria TaxID=2 RepID=UPI003F99D1A0